MPSTRNGMPGGPGTPGGAQGTSPRAGAARRPNRLAAAVGARMRGPGGYYNSGNLLGLAVGLWLQITGAGADAGLGESVFAYLAGNGSALAMTVATVVFLCSGELYHRAWPKEGAPDERLNRIADLLSGVGALALGWALWLLGQPLLAATAGALHAFGKLASAVAPDGHAAWRRWPASWPDPFRGAVVASRVPALLAAAADLWRAAAAVLMGAEAALALAMPATLVACYLLWTRADLLLFEGGGGEADVATPLPSAAGR